MTTALPASSTRAAPPLEARIPPSAVDILAVGRDAAGALASIGSDRRMHIRLAEEVLREQSGDTLYDCIVLGDEAARTADPWQLLSRLAGMLRTGGLLLLDVANLQNWCVVRNLLEGHWHGHGDGSLELGHLRFFTRESLEGLLWTAGLQIESIDAVDCGSPVPDRVLRALERTGMDTAQLAAHGKAGHFCAVARRPGPVPIDARVAIIVLNWNGKSDTLACLESLAAVDYGALDVIVVDNGSSDDSANAIRASHPEVTVLETGANLGFAEGNNVGIRHALACGAEYVLLLNNDTEVAPGLIEGFMKVAHTCPDAGIIGARIYYHGHPDTIWYAGGYWDHDQMCFQQTGDGQPDHAAFARVSRTDFVVGCAMFIPRRVLEDVGLLESSFFLNYEEIDYCTRVRAAGYDLLYAPDARLWHKIAASFGGDESPLKIYFTFRNRLLWARRNLPLRRRIAIHLSVYRWFRPRFLHGFDHLKDDAPLPERLRSLYWSLGAAFGSPVNQAWLRGIADFWRGHFGPCPQGIWQLNRRWAESRRK
ncbi:glycosyltransferase [Methyloversatilis sp.]|uniref:glycosyltransferase n=1 Tax=Methyloversatilis sp. TaxID=2569862 RepID=UPI0035B4CD53